MRLCCICGRHTHGEPPLLACCVLGHAAAVLVAEEPLSRASNVASRSDLKQLLAQTLTYVCEEPVSALQRGFAVRRWGFLKLHLQAVTGACWRTCRCCHCCVRVTLWGDPSCWCACSTKLPVLVYVVVLLTQLRHQKIRIPSIREEAAPLYSVLTWGAPTCRALSQPPHSIRA